MIKQGERWRVENGNEIHGLNENGVDDVLAEVHAIDPTVEDQRARAIAALPELYEAARDALSDAKAGSHVTRVNQQRLREALVAVETDSDPRGRGIGGAE